MSTNYIDQITDTAGTTQDISESDSTRIFRATCSTAASTAAKVATLQTSNKNFSLATGVRVAVTFTYGNSADTPTLRVDGSSTGTAKTIAIASSATAKTTGNGTTYNTWGPYETVLFTYDGTYWVNGGSSRSIYNAYSQASAAGTGTVTSVGITNGGGLSISGSPITTSGSITVGHSNSVTAQTTQAVYPIKIDAYGHISAYGSAVTIPTDTNTTYSLSGALSSHKVTSTLTAGGSGSGTSTSDFTLAEGTGITITDNTSTRTMTIACSVTNTDEKVKLTSNTGSTAVPIVLGPTSITSGTAYNCLYNANLKYTPSTGNLQTTQLNGVTVGTTPKFTDTVTTVTSSGSGNVVTGMTASNGAITYTLGTVSTTAAQIIRW